MRLDLCDDGYRPAYDAAGVALFLPIVAGWCGQDSLSRTMPGDWIVSWDPRSVAEDTPIE
jgi:hypothetical protein